MKEERMNRQETNLKIANILKGTTWHELAVQLETLAKKFPQQRAGQIICNYICQTIGIIFLRQKLKQL